MDGGLGAYPYLDAGPRCMYAEGAVWKPLGRDVPQPMVMIVEDGVVFKFTINEVLIL
jgi:hypothetical protein